MTIQCGRIHLAKADRSQGLDAEEEGVSEAVRPSIRHRTRNEPEEAGEDDVHRQIMCEQGREELRPGQSNGEMVGIAQIEARNALLFVLVGAEANPRHLFTGRALDWNAALPLLYHRPCVPPPALRRSARRRIWYRQRIRSSAPARRQRPVAASQPEGWPAYAAR